VFRAINASDLPYPGTGLGGVQAKAVVLHSYLTGISSVDGSVTAAQPSSSDLSDANNIALLNALNVFTGVMKINLNAAASPSAITGTGLLVNAADGVNGRVQINSYGTMSNLTVARYDGTGAAPTAVQSGDQIGGLNAYAYNGTSLVGPIASIRPYAAENVASGHQGSKVCIATTPLASTTAVDSFCVGPNGAVSITAVSGQLNAAAALAMANTFGGL
jgi:hypothetical protein